MKNISKQKTITICISLTIISLLLLIIINIYQNYLINKNMNQVILSLTNEVQKKYPEVDDEQVVNILEGDYSYKNSIQDKYGYNKNSSYIKNINTIQKSTLILNITILLLLSVSILITYLIYLKSESNKIKNINDYLKEINKKNYTLKIEENGEGELSRLQNELLKTTILLKETADTNKFEKKMLNNSLADISHQLKTPLTSITIMLDNINSNPDMDKKTKDKFIKEIMKQIDWINSLVISILKVSKFDSGTIELINKEIDVKDLITDIIDSLSILLDVKNITIKTSNLKGSFTADYKWQKEALTNILKNAIEHSPEDSSITIDAENTNLFLKLTIKNTGEGITKDDCKHIFERFYQAKNKKSTSTGIGLNLAKTIIEKENGTIQVSSIPNEETTFTIKYLKI